MSQVSTEFIQYKRRIMSIGVVSRQRLSIVSLSRIFMSRIFHPPQHCATVSISHSFHHCILVPLIPFSQFPLLHFCAAVSISRSFHSCILVPLIPFPLFHVSHFQRPRNFHLGTVADDEAVCRHCLQILTAETIKI